MTEQLRILTALVEDSKDPSSVPSTRIRQLTTICNLSCRESNALFQPPWHPAWAFPCVHAQTQTHRNQKIFSEDLKRYFFSYYGLGEVIISTLQEVEGPGCSLAVRIIMNAREQLFF